MNFVKQSCATEGGGRRFEKVHICEIYFMNSLKIDSCYTPTFYAVIGLIINFFGGSCCLATLLCSLFPWNGCSVKVVRVNAALFVKSAIKPESFRRPVEVLDKRDKEFEGEFRSHCPKCSLECPSMLWLSERRLRKMTNSLDQFSRFAASWSCADQTKRFK